MKSLFAIALIGLGTAAEADCRLALLLGLDISSSVDQSEDALQRQGLAQALRATSVRQAALATPDQPIALAVFEWSGRYQQDVLLDWTILQSHADLDQAASRIANSHRSYSEFPTALGYALGYAHTLLRQAPPCLFQTLDMSGDGMNNEGFGPDLAYENFDFSGITVNGLPIRGHDENVVSHYETEVIRGPGSFVEIAHDFTDFERAMRRKLEREMGTRIIGSIE